VLTQGFDKDNPRRTTSETILQNVRIIAIDQEIEQGQSAPANNATGPGKPPNHPVSLELKPEEVQKIAVAKKLGTLSLAIRPDESLDAPVRAGVRDVRAGTGDTPRTTLSHDVSPEIARQNEKIARQQACKRAIAIARERVTVYAGGKDPKIYPVKTNDPVTCSPLEEAPINPAAVGSVSIPANANGHFYPKVSINGTPVRLMADTGATLVALSVEDARKIGIDPQSLQFTDRADTANGPRQAAPITLSEITIEGIMLRNVPASCCVTGTSLLGMSALGQLGVEMKDGWMLLSSPGT
jgi:clan AA aspartic protease (TIGR02281 family)